EGNQKRTERGEGGGFHFWGLSLKKRGGNFWELLGEAGNFLGEAGKSQRVPETPSKFPENSQQFKPAFPFSLLTKNQIFSETS
ncbi:MAG: hypothetical protein K6C40_04500, partial [Thermoguttaceae bacterium]|nr:hypothetical protein [Thermoguttaceae bacterium]